MIFTNVISYLCYTRPQKWYSLQNQNCAIVRGKRHLYSNTWGPVRYSPNVLLMQVNLWLRYMCRSSYTLSVIWNTNGFETEIYYPCHKFTICLKSTYHAFTIYSMIRIHCVHDLQRRWTGPICSPMIYKQHKNQSHKHPLLLYIIYVGIHTHNNLLENLHISIIFHLLCIFIMVFWSVIKLVNCRKKNVIKITLAIKDHVGSDSMIHITVPPLKITIQKKILIVENQ